MQTAKKPTHQLGLTLASALERARVKTVGKRNGNGEKTQVSPYNRKAVTTVEQAKAACAYRNGIGVFKKQLSPQIRLEVKFCERCALDLSNAKNGFWVVHHRDHNRSNNE